MTTRDPDTNNVQSACANMTQKMGNIKNFMTRKSEQETQAGTDKQTQGKNIKKTKNN